MNEEDKKKAAIAFGEQFAKAAIPIYVAGLEVTERGIIDTIEMAFLAGELYTEALFKQAEKAGLTIQQQAPMQQGLIQVPRTNNSN